MKLNKLLFVVFALMWATISLASHTVKVYETNGQIFARIFRDENGVEKILFRVLPYTADRNPKGAVLRINGVTVKDWRAPAYEFEFNLDSDSLPALTGDLTIPWLKGDPDQKLDLKRFRVGVNTAEVFFVTVDDRGRIDRNKTAAASLQFSIEDDPTPAGQTFDAKQLDAAAKQGYKQGASDAAAAASGDNKKLKDQLAEKIAENNKLRDELAKLSKGQGQKDQGIVPVTTLNLYGLAFTPTGDMRNGYTREHYLLLAKRAMAGGKLDLSHPVKVRPGQSYMLLAVSSDKFTMVVANGDDVNSYDGVKVGDLVRYGRVLCFPQGIGKTTVTVSGQVVTFEAAGGMAR